MSLSLPVRIIAEAGVNHNGSLTMALQLIDAAHSAGANAVKFQTFRPGSLVTRMASKAEYQRRRDAACSQFDMLQSLQLSDSDYEKLQRHCQAAGIEFLSTPFDLDSLSFLVNDLGLKTIKVSSGDLTNAPLLLAAARNGVLIILSTGMATLGEVEQALAVLAFGYTLGDPPSRFAFMEAYASLHGRAFLKDRVTLLHCTTEYPCPPQEVNLKAMETLRVAFDLGTGYSDHTEGISTAIAAVAMGASVLEKHFTLDRNLPGPDHAASLEPADLKQMVESIRFVEQAIGTGEKAPTTSEWNNRAVVRRSIVAARKIRAGEVFTTADLALKRPGDGLPAILYWETIGRVACRDFAEDEMIAW